MRVLSYILVILGCSLLGRAAYQQDHGVTNEPVILVREKLAGIVKSGELVKQKDPEDFRVAMTFHWMFGIVISFAGVGLYLHIRKQERLDPFSPDFEIKDEDK